MRIRMPILAAAGIGVVVITSALWATRGWPVPAVSRVPVGLGQVVIDAQSAGREVVDVPEGSGTFVIAMPYCLHARWLVEQDLLRPVAAFEIETYSYSREQVLVVEIEDHKVVNLQHLPPEFEVNGARITVGAGTRLYLETETKDRSEPHYVITLEKTAQAAHDNPR